MERKLAADIISTISELKNLGWTNYEIEKEIAGMLKTEIDYLKAGLRNFPFYSSLVIGVVLGGLTATAVLWATSRL